MRLSPGTARAWRQMKPLLTLKCHLLKTQNYLNILQMLMRGQIYIWSKYALLVIISNNLSTL